MFEIEWVNGNIVNVPAEAIVCPTSPGFSKVGPGVEAAVYKASREELKNKRDEILKTLSAKGAHLKAGDVYVTKSFFNKNQGNSVTKYILHVVGTSARKKCLADVVDVYAQCYTNILAHTVDYHCSTVAIPILGSRGSRMEYMEAFKMEYAILSALNKAESYYGIEKIYLTTFLLHEEGNWGDVSKFLGMKEPRRRFGELHISKEQYEFYKEINYTEEIYYDNVEMAIWDARKNAFLSSERQNETIFSSVWNNLMHQREYEKRYTRAYIERVTDIPSTTYRRILNGEMNPTRNQVIVLSIVAGLAPHQTDKLLDTIKAAHLRPDDTLLNGELGASKSCTLFSPVFSDQMAPQKRLRFLVTNHLLIINTTLGMIDKSCNDLYLDITKELRTLIRSSLLLSAFRGTRYSLSNGLIHEGLSSFRSSSR